MLLTSPLPLLLSALVLSTPSTAAPTRTHCRCTIVSDAPPSAQQTPSSAHWTPSDPISSPPASNTCSNLGPELQNYKHSQPSLYNAYLQKKSTYSTPNSMGGSQRPFTTTTTFTTLTLDRAAAQDPSPELEKEPRPTTRPHERIVCYLEPEPFSAYQDSFVTLWALHIIVAVAILACAAEGVQMGMRWINRAKDGNYNHSHSPGKLESKLRLTGAERLLCAFPQNEDANLMFSPGLEKKTQAYLNFVAKPPSEKCEFIAYDDEDDDEANRPVM